MTSTTLSERPGVDLRKIALPVEHGGWGIVFEPVVLGLIVAPAWPAVLLMFAAAGVFLTRQPLRIVLSDRILRRQRFPRTAAAEGFVLLYGVTAIAALALAVWFSNSKILVPLAVAAPFALVQILYDAKNRSRSMLPEIAGAIAMGATAAMMALAGGLGTGLVALLWILITARSVCAIVYVRARLRLEHGQGRAVFLPMVTHLAALLFALGLFRLGEGPLLAVVAFGILLGRAIVGLSALRSRIPARQIGWREIGYGTTSVLLIGLGFALGW
ncbi:MAG TPA: YwiC-like family protein [Thermoanaerobaculia bacterium]|nr:YwiC-like family protein [Thermoanaerobaculia bacterium]